MKPKILAKFSQLYLDESVKDEKKLKKNIFQDLRGSVTVPNEPKVAYWLRRRKRENASEKTFFVRPQRPLRFRTIPPLLLPALYALPAIIGGINMYLKKYQLLHCSYFPRSGCWPGFLQHEAAPCCNPVHVRFCQ